MILKMNSSYRVENGANRELTLSSLQSLIETETSMCMNYSNAQELIDSKSIQTVKSIIFDRHSYRDILRNVNSIVTKDGETLNKSTNANWESWARHLLTFLNFINAKSMRLRLGLELF